MRRHFPQSLSVFLFVLIAAVFVSGVQTGSTVWPGQAGNLVGFAAYGSLGTTPWPGGGFQSGTASNPAVYTGYVFTGQQTISGSYIEFVSCDFNSGTNGVLVSGSNITFVGSRFQSNSTENYNVQTSGSNITFLYSSFTPLASLYTAPPGSTWPSAGAGANTINQTTNTNAIDGNDGFEYGINITSGGPVTIDHSDFWGYGNAIVFYSTTAQMTVTNSWIHDSANANSQGYHTDGPGYLNGGTGPSNVTVLGNTIASLGNTNGIAFQSASSGYNNMQINGNYLSGFGYTTAPGEPGNTHFSNSAVMSNTFGTDVEPVWGPLYRNGFTGGTNSLWACNRLVFLPGTNWTDGDGWTPNSSINGLYWIPTTPGGVASPTDYNGNTVCPSFGPSSLAWSGQQVNVTSSGQNVTLTNTGTGSITGLSVALLTGTQFAISSNSCGSSLASGATCSVAVTFTPTSLGPKADSLQFSDNAAAPSSTQSVPLLGFGSQNGAPGAPTGLTAKAH